jgi:hypothetical protein
MFAARAVPKLSQYLQMSATKGLGLGRAIGFP